MAGLITTVARLETECDTQPLLLFSSEPAALLIPSLTQPDGLAADSDSEGSVAKWMTSETMFGKTPHSIVMKQTDDLRI